MINNGSPRSLTKCFISNVERFAFMNRTCLRTIWHINHVMRDDGSPRSLMCLFNVEILSVFRWTCLDCILWSSISSVAKLLHTFASRKRVIWGVVFTHPVGCSRQLSAVNGLTATNQKILQVNTSEVLWKDGTHNGSPRSIMSLFTWAQLRTFLWIVMSSTRNRFIATKTCWRKNSMMGAIAGISRMALFFSRFLVKTVYVVNTSLVRFFQTCWERSTNSCIESTLAKCHFWAALWRSRTTGHSVQYAALSRAHMCLTFDDFSELHQESFHCHQDVLDEEDDGCHFWCCQEGIGASRSSPDSRWRRCNFVNASLKSERSFIGSLRPGVERDPPIFFESKVLVLRHSIGEIFLRVLVHLGTDFFSSINFELRFTKCWIVLEAIVNPFKTLFDASLFSNYGQYSVLFVL